MTISVAGEVVPAPADALAIDFANTRYWRGSPVPTETLSGMPDLLDWAASTALVPAAALERFRAVWTRDADQAGRAFTQAMAWREATFRGLAAASSGSAPMRGDIRLLNDALAEAPARQRVSASERGWEVGVLPPKAAALLAPVLWSAGDLLLGPKLARVRQCANPACLFLFLDESKGGNRRWCTMAGCGNRAKAHRHYLRHRAKGS